VDNKTSNFYIRLPIIIGISIACGILFGSLISGSGTKNATPSTFKQADKFKSVLHYINQDYVDPVNIEGITETAIEDVLRQLDPHSHYIPAKDLEYTESELRGEFEGVGIAFNIFSDSIFVMSVIAGGPADEAGIQPRDRIIRVNDEPVASVNITSKQVMNKLRGPKGSEVRVQVYRPGLGKKLDFTLTRSKIPSYSLDASYMIDDEVGYIKLSHFSATTYEEFMQAMTELRAEGMKKLILDLQSNGGGYLEQATKLVDEFLANNRMIVYTKGKKKKYDQEILASHKGVFEEEPVIVLINENSASASEIVAGALQDHDRALIVGRRSFGKGLVQMSMDLEDGSQLRLTISRYYTPSGRSIQKSYDNGVEAYTHDHLDRYENGEFFHRDSIKFNDSLIYTTEHGRTVYGGGGIMPDMFVPLDTAHQTPYLNKLMYSTAMRTYMLDYREDHREDLEAMGLRKYASDFYVSDKVLKELVEKASEEGVSFNEAEYEISKSYLKTFIKAEIAEGIWGRNGFQMVMNGENEILKKALTLFDKAAMLAKNQ